MRHFAVVMAAVIFLGSSVCAIEPSVPLHNRVVDAARTFSEADILREFGSLKRTRGDSGGALVKKLVKAGRVVRWGGSVVFGALAAYDALEWLYKQTQNATGTALDDWYNSKPHHLDESSSSMTYRVPAGYGPVSERMITPALMLCQGLDWDGKWRAYWVGHVAGHSEVWFPSTTVRDKKGKVWSGFANGHQTTQQAAVSVLKAAGACSSLRQPSDVPLEDVFRNDPKAVTALRDLVVKYLQAHPSVTSTSVYPFPNANQLADAVVDPNLDTDGDGITDAEARRRNPAVVIDPDVAADFGDVRVGSETSDDTGKAIAGEAVGVGVVAGTKLADVADVKIGDKKVEEEVRSPVSDQCGDFALRRLFVYPGHYLRDVVFPCREMGDMLQPVTDLLKQKFPFSLAASLDGWFSSVPTGEGNASALPKSLGVIPLDWGWLAPLWVLIKSIVGVALWVWFIYWLIDRFTPRAVI